MIRKVIYLVLFFSISNYAFCQGASSPSSAVNEKNDTLRLFRVLQFADAFSETKPDSSFYYAEEAVQLSRKMKLRLDEASALIHKGYALLNMGNYPSALQATLQALNIAEDPNSSRHVLPQQYSKQYRLHYMVDLSPEGFRKNMIGRTHHYLGIIYGNANNHEKELYHYLRSKEVLQNGKNVSELSAVFMTLGRVYLSLKKLDSALHYQEKALSLATAIRFERYMGSILLNLARVHQARGNNLLAISYFKRAISASYRTNYLRGVVAGNLALADMFRSSGAIDSGFHYANTALGVANNINAPGLLLRCYITYSSLYKAADNKDSLVKYQDLVIRLNDSVFNSKQAQLFQNVDFEEQQRKKEIEVAKEAYLYRLRVYALLAGIVLFLVIAILLWRNIEHRKQANAILHNQNVQLEATLKKLETTQMQLVQSEKMASLGELTAGIAHEIQNPLNFVNNFSETNIELINEMKEELGTGNGQQALIIAEDIKQNEEKINNHGKRADAIVKNMLQHSRSNAGKKELIDINTLVDEYLRLSYNGLRAKDKSFNALFETHFDTTVKRIEVVPQELGRVLLNLFNNAFYSVNQKKKQLNGMFEPTVTVTTKKRENKVEIIIKDNGVGIPEKMLNKIYQPFFTTKPTGEGTGLGLSLSYDIIKAHGGEMKVETKEGEGAEFIISLPG
jgi:signal transduction histidine kinase